MAFIGIIEEGEICDCGTVKNCAEFDDCCIPRGRSGECHVSYANAHECHPSEGFCCSDKCHISDLSEYNMVRSLYILIGLMEIFL